MSKPKYIIKQILASPKSYDSFSLFEFSVNRLVQKMNQRFPMDLENGDDAFKSHIQWTNLIFGSGNEINQKYLSKVKSDFGSYFIHRGNKYKWDFPKILIEHPAFFSAIKSPTLQNPDSEMLLALEHEIVESKRDTQKNRYDVFHIEKIKLHSGDHIYCAALDIEQDEDPKLVEDLPITIRIGALTFDTQVLDYDKVSNHLFFNLSPDLSKYYGKISIQSDASWILVKIKDILQTKEFGLGQGDLIKRFKSGNTKPKKITPSDSKIKPEIDSLDDSQSNAYYHAIENDISIIWGPPGTGKSHTLACIIDTFYKKKEKTLITCIANVAVDSITLKLIDLIENQNLLVKQGEILRIGHTRDSRLLKTEYLFPDNDKTKLLRHRILEIDKALENSKKGDNLELKKERQEYREQLNKEVQTLIGNSIINFATTSKFFVDSTLNDKEYDNLIIDEASMVSIPHFVALGLKIRKRIIITGDFRQLGPVVLSQSEVSKKWLHRDIFEYSGIDPRKSTIEHDALKQLLIQRRSNEQICNLINKPFYEGKLISDTKFINDTIVHTEPFKGHVIVYKPLKSGNKVEFTKKGSRTNQQSATEVLHILDSYSTSNAIGSIGIITPYRGQVKLIQDLITTRGYSKEFKSLLRVGTIHAFQGSECDLIILDTVDSLDENIGKLYRFEMGKRLVNVALSRAKHKLIVCGDLDVFIEGKGHNNVDSALKNIFKRLKYYESNE